MVVGDTPTNPNPNPIPNPSPTPTPNQVDDLLSPDALAELQQYARSPSPLP